MKTGTTEHNASEIPENSNIISLFCESNFSEDRRGRKWIHSQSCNLWAHIDCTCPES